MVKFEWTLHKTSVLSFILIIINEKSIFGPSTDTFVSAFQQFFRVRPSHQEVIEGNEVLLQCQVANQAGLVQWSKEGFALGFDPEVPGWPRYYMIVDQLRGVYNLNIKNLQLIDEGEFECQVGPAEDNRAIRSNARINVLVPPQEVIMRSANRALVFNITKQKLSHITSNNRLEVREAERIKLVCNTSTPTKPTTHIKWFKNGIPLTRESYSIEIRDGLGTLGKLSATSSSVSIYTKLDDNGVKYSCQAEHPALTKPIKSSITLSVLYPPGLPTIEGYTSGDVISVGDTLHLACISSGGNPLAKLIWYKESQEVDNTYSSGGGRESTNIFSFTVSSKDNNAIYKCEATNDVTPHPLIAFTKLKVLFPAVRVEIIGSKQGKIGDVLTLICLAGPANPSAEVSWNVEGRSVIPLNTWTSETKEGWISGSNITLTLSSQDVNSIGLSCSAFSETLGETIVQSFTVDILYPPGVPYIIGYEEGTNLAAGEIYRFKCVSMGGNPLPTLKWQVMSVGTDAALDRQISALTSISASGVSSELVIRAQSSDNGATYKCEASNAATIRPLNTSVKLSVFYTTDSVTIKIKPKYPKSGELLNLVCDSGPCNPLCDLFWYKNNIKINGQFDGVSQMDVPFGAKNTRNRLQLDVTTRDDESAIICEAVNQFVNKSIVSNITLRVFYKPEFVGPPFQKFDVIEGSDISVNLSARGNPSLISYLWTKDSIPLFDISDTITTTMSNSLITQRPHQRLHQLITEGSVLTIKNVLREDTGDYDCQASNTEGLTKTTITINVLFGPLIVDISKTVFVDSGESVSLFCMAVGNPMNDEVIEWRREGKTNLMKDSRINVKIEKGRSTLWISNVSPEKDVGEYECRANNGIGREALERVKLLIKTKPEIIKNMTTVNVATQLAHSAKLVCSATGVPNVQFKWITHYNEFISTEDQLLINTDIKYFGYGLERKQISETVFQSALTIKRITDRELNKSFKCIAHNEKGETETDIKLRKRGKPDPPNDIKVINITHNSIFLGWSPGFDGGVKQSFRIKYYKIETNNYEVKESDKNWILINGLESDSKYSFNVFSFNTFGENDWKDSNNSIHVLTYTTEFDSSEPLIDGLNAVNSNPNNKSVSTIIMIIVFVLGLILIILNASLVICYIKWKKHIQSRNKNQRNDKKAKLKSYNTTTNGTPILMKAYSEEDVSLNTSIVQIADQTNKRCEVLLMTELDSSSSSSLPQPVARVLLTDCHISNSSKRLSLETDNCPDIIKNPIIDNNIMDSTNFGDLSRQQMNNYCNNIEVVNNTNNSMIYSHNNRIQTQNSEKFHLKSILKNGSLKKQEIHLL